LHVNWHYLREIDYCTFFFFLSHAVFKHRVNPKFYRGKTKEQEAKKTNTRITLENLWEDTDGIKINS